MQRGGEALHLVGDAVLVAVRHGPDVGLARAHEGYDPLGTDGHVAGVRNDRVKIDLEAIRQVYALENFADRVGVFAFLFDVRKIPRAGRLELPQFLEVALGARGPGHGNAER